MRRHLLALGGLALAACGGESLLVPTTLSLDSATCNTKAPGQISFSCDSAVGVWVRRGDPAEPDTADDACVDFATSTSSLAGLPDILSDNVDLSGLSAGDLWVEMAVFSPGAASDGCPEITDYSDQMSIYGRTRTTEVGTSRGLRVQLFCYAVDDGTLPADCLTRCDEVRDYCPDSAESGPCDLDYDDCFNACGAEDEPCFALCDRDYEICLADQPTPCLDAETLCYEGCPAGDLDCEDACFNGYDDCVRANCATDYTVCQGRCNAMPDSCATAPGGS